MSKLEASHDASRRRFLVRAGVSAGAVAGASLAPEALAQNHQQDKKAPAPSDQDGHGALMNANIHGAFFNHEQAAAVAAFTERLMPGAQGKPGALDAGVLNYIDLALAGAYSDLQDFYRRGLAQLDQYCHGGYQTPFSQLTAAQQDEVITAIEDGKATGFAWPTAQEFFSTIRTHTMEGMFADPVYGGNRDFAGWRLVGFPGAQAIFTHTDMQSKQAFARLPITGLQARAKKS